MDQSLAHIKEVLVGNKVYGRDATDGDLLAAFRQMTANGQLRTLEPLLPLCLKLDGKPYTLADHFPFSPVFRTAMPSTLVLKTGRQVSKCGRISDDNRVSLANGRQVPGHQLKIGDKVLAFDQFTASSGRVIDKIDAGRKMTFRVTTRLGSVLDIADTHPLRTLAGWIPLKSLTVGDRIAAAREGGNFGKMPISDRVLLTAYMLGDGCFGLSGNWSFTAAPGQTLQEFVELASRNETAGVVPKLRDGSTAYQVRLHTDNRILTWAEADGLAGKGSLEKFIPAWVFDLDRSAAAMFVSRLWATDGWITTAENGTPAIGYCSISRQLAFDLKALLTKFGILTSVSQRPASYRDDETGELVECHDAYVVRVETRTGWRRFFSEFTVPDKPAVVIPETPESNNRDTVPIAVGEIIADIAGERRGTRGPALYQHGLRKKPKHAMTYGKLERYVTFFQQHCAGHPRLQELQDLLTNDITWDEIISIEKLGMQRCWDVEIATHHNYVMNGVLTHNSTSLASHGVMLSNCIPHFRTLYVTPLYEQIRRFSNNYVRKFIDQSPVKSLWSGTSTENSVLQRSFKNYSVMLFSFALLDADRVRGISAHKVAIDEVQDMDPDHIPIIRETMSHSPFGSLMQLTGTPKSMDNPLQGLWVRSSQAEWFVPCHACGEWNIPTMDYHLDAMIGPMHSAISEEYPGTVCHKCRSPIFPRQGHWVHRYPDRRYSMAGYHVPQIIMPLHYARPDKWNELCAKRDGWGGTSQAVYYNEVMGESIDSGQKLVSETEIKRAATLPWENTPDNPSVDMLRMLKHYPMRILAADWGGGGQDGVSFTTLALLGFSPSGRIDLLWGKRLVLSQDHLKEAHEALTWLRFFRCHLFAHDYTGAGIVRETVMVQAGFDLNKVMPIQYVRAAASNLMRFVEATPLHNRNHYRLDKTRCLLYVCQAIKLGLLQSFRYDYTNADNPGLLHDFLALVEEKAESRTGSDIYTITRNPMLTDDFAQAVNIGCAALWHANDAWPDYAKATAAGQLTAAQVQAAGSVDYGWEQDLSTNSFLQVP